jgi:CRISPR-associated endonuclease/helicase Cas3
VRWVGGAEPHAEMTFARKLRPGDLLVVPADYRGCDAHGWAPDQPEGERVDDVADLAAWGYRRSRFVLRLTPARLEAERAAARGRLHRPVDADALQAELDVIDAVAGRLEAFLNAQREPESGLSAEACLDALREGLDVAETADDHSLRQRLCAFDARRTELHFPYALGEEGRPTGLVLVAPKGVELGDAPLTAWGQPATEDDALGHGSEPQGLVEHSRQVCELAVGFADRLGLPGEVAKAVRLAAYAHDAGKADARFQRLLQGRRWGAGGLLAKSGARSTPGAWERAGLPQGWRHEALSVRLATATLPAEPDYDAGLALWLVGAHHGLGRPFFPHEDGADQEPRMFEAVDGLLPAALPSGPGPQRLGFAVAGPAFDGSPYAGMDWAELFATLRARYGAWELARLEAVVRLADHRASEAGGEPS